MPDLAHRLFARQLAKAKTANGDVDLTVLAGLVVSAYEEMERDRRRTDRSISLMAQELEERLVERERSTELLRAQKLQLDAAVNNMSQGLCMSDAQGQTVLYNQRYLKITGHSAEFVTEHPSLLERFRVVAQRGWYNGEDSDRLYAQLVQEMRLGKTVVKTVHAPDGKVVRITDRPMANGGWVATFEDVTEWHKQEESFRLLFDNNPIPMMVWDLGSLQILAANDAALVHYGYSRKQFLRLNVLDIRPPDQRALFLKQLPNIEQLRANEWIHQKSDGSTFTAKIYQRQIQYQSGPARLAAIIDITERARAEEERDRNRQFLDRVIENVTMTILVKDARTRRYVLANRTAERLLGLQRGEIIGKTPREIFDGATAEAIEANDRKLLEQGANFFVSEPEFRTPRNGVRVITSNRITIRGPSGEVQYILSVVDDVTERKAVEDQLRQAQKMEAIGQLTGGVAHDFNNLLTVIMGNLDLLREDTACNPSAEQKIEAILQAAERGADLTRHMLAFSRRQPLQPEEVDVNALIARTAQLLSRTLGENVAVDVRQADGLPAVTVDASQLETALLNIAINARDAMPNGGTLTVATRLARLDADYAARHLGVSAGAYVAIEISDTGSGMPPDVRERIFEPFFTTKPSEKGTGLGLSMVYGFIKQSGGHIRVYSEVGHGTTFRLFLPLVPKAQPPAATSGASRAAKRLGQETTGGKTSGQATGEKTIGQKTILAVEDDPDIRKTVVRQLRDLGYQVHEADNAKAALYILGGGERIDLLFTDMILPGGVNGKELASRARARRPGLKVLFTSGFPGTSNRPGAQLEPSDLLLSKPYQAQDLAEAIAAALTAPA